MGASRRGAQRSDETRSADGALRHNFQIATDNVFTKRIKFIQLETAFDLIDLDLSSLSMT